MVLLLGAAPGPGGFNRCLNKIRVYIRSMRRTRRVRQRGGELIGEGGYGCVFRPALACENEMPPEPRSDYVSKLMSAEHAQAELEEGRKVRRALARAPPSLWAHIELPEDMVCVPGTISAEDLEGFERCEALASLGIRATNVNEHLDELGLLTARYGGVDLDTYWAGVPELTPAAFAAINTALMTLLAKGVMPLAAYGVSHLDIKAGNVLRTEENGRTRLKLIDWGLMATYKLGSRTSIPAAVSSRPMQHNLPWSVVLFDPEVAAAAERVFKQAKGPGRLKPPHAGRREVARAAAAAAVDECAGGRTAGHLSYILSWLGSYYAPLLTLDARESGAGVAIAAVVDYLAEALYAFTGADGRFQARRYFNRVFSPNADLYGAVMCYAPALQKCWVDPRTRSPFSDVIRPSACLPGSVGTGIWRLLSEYCISPIYAATPIPHRKLLRSMASLGPSPPPRVDTAAHRRCPPGKSRNPLTRRCRRDR